MASHVDPRENTPEKPCTNAPSPDILRTSQTLSAKAEIPAPVYQHKEPAPRLQSLFANLQARFG